LFGILFSLIVCILSRKGTEGVAAVTSAAIPILAGLFLLLSAVILISHRERIPFILRSIWRQAWDVSSAVGGTLGFGVSRAVRYGIVRGIFSNEAGCGTSPTAHAAANTKSPHHQGCFGIFEVWADTVLLCTITALVILCYGDREGLDGIALALTAYTRLAEETGGTFLGIFSQWILRISIVFFALATVICQNCYGMEAVRYFSEKNILRRGYRILSTGAIFLGTIIPTSLMWQWADTVVTIMTLWNIGCLLLLRRDVQ
jgi:AGCS family alanine or glycine:cation symporter